MNKGMFNFSETESYSLGLEKLGFETRNFVLNAGTELILLLTMVIFVVIWGICACLQKMRNSKIAGIIKGLIANRLMWSSFIDFFKMGQIGLTLVAIIQLKKFGWSEDGDIYSSVMSIIIIIAFALYPIVIFVILVYFTTIDQLKSTFFVEKFGTITYGLRTNSKY